MELDRNVVGNDVEGGPWPFADGKVAAPDGEAAVETGAIALGGVGQWSDDGLRFALDRQLAGDFVAVAAERFETARFKTRGREGLGVEPLLAADLVVGLAGTSECSLF